MLTEIEFNIFKSMDDDSPCLHNMDICHSFCVYSSRSTDFCWKGLLQKRGKLYIAKAKIKTLILEGKSRRQIFNYIKKHYPVENTWN